MNIGIKLESFDGKPVGNGILDFTETKCTKDEMRKRKKRLTG